MIVFGFQVGEDFQVQRCRHEEPVCMCSSIRIMFLLLVGSLGVVLKGAFLSCCANVWGFCIAFGLQVASVQVQPFCAKETCPVVRVPGKVSAYSVSVAAQKAWLCLFCCFLRCHRKRAIGPAPHAVMTTAKWNSIEGLPRACCKYLI